MDGEHARGPQAQEQDNPWNTVMLEELHMPWEVTEQLMGHRLPGVSGQHYIRPSVEQQIRAAVDAFNVHLG